MAHSAFDNAFITKQLTKLVSVYEQPLVTLEEAIAQLIEQHPLLQPRFQRLLKVKGLGLLSLAVLVGETKRL